MLFQSTGENTCHVLIDYGFSLNQFLRRLEKSWVSSNRLDAIFVNHEHDEPTSCVQALSTVQHSRLDERG